MTPEEAQNEYMKRWPALHDGKVTAIARGDKVEAKRYRQLLSALSSECSARHELRYPREDNVCPCCGRSG